MSDDRSRVLGDLNTLAETCKAALAALNNKPADFSDQQAPLSLLRHDMLSLHQLIHSYTTRLSVALGKPPPSYPLALDPLKFLTTHVGQLSACVASFPTGALRKEAITGTMALLRALETLARHFAGQDEGARDEYLVWTGAVHDTVATAENMSNDEAEALQKAWRVNGESLEDSLREIKEIMEQGDDVNDNDDDDGWDELGKEFGRKLSPEEMERVKKVYPLIRLTTLLHERILSHHIMKPPPSNAFSQTHMANLLRLSDALLPATDDLVSAMYSEQDLESIQEAADAVHNIAEQCKKELDPSGDETVRKGPKQQGVEGKSEGSKSQKWFELCFVQIDNVYRSLHIDRPS